MPAPAITRVATVNAAASRIAVARRKVVNSSYVSALGPVTGAVPAVKTRISSWGAGYGSGRSSTQSTTENTAALIPIPIASDSPAVTVTTG